MYPDLCSYCFVIQANNIQLLTYVEVDLECYWTVNVTLNDTERRSICLSLLFNNTPCLLQGYRLTFFRQGQAGPLKQNDCGPRPKLRGPWFGGKLNQFQYHWQAFALLIRDPQNLYFSNYLPYQKYLKSAEWRFVNFQQLVSDLTRLHTFSNYPFFRGKLGPLTFNFRGPAQNLEALGYWAPVSLFPCTEI